MPILLISLLFAVKAFYLAFWVTPLLDIPDETGHFAYVRDIAQGRGVPLLGQAEIPSDIMRHANRAADASPVSNWIAQHPPVYYVLAALPYKIGSFFTSDPEILFRLPRMIAVLCGALLLLVLFRSFLLVGLDSSRATAMAAAVGFIPMVSNLSSGTNHDMLLFLFCALATLNFARYLIQRSLRHAYGCAFWLTAAGGTKMTSWVFIAPMVVFMLMEMPGPIKNWTKHAAGISLLAFSAPLAWMARNVVHFGNPFQTAAFTAGSGLAKPLQHGFFDYLHLQPVFEHYVLNFYGLFGWIGTGVGQCVFYQVDGLPRSIFSMLLFGLAAIFAFYVLELAGHAFRHRYPIVSEDSLLSRMGNLIAENQSRRVIVVLAIVLAILFSGYIGTTSFRTSSLGGCLRLLAVSILIFAGIVALALSFLIHDSTDRIALYGMVLLVFFGAVVLYQTYGLYLYFGQMRATHGRYFYPVMPLVLLSAARAVRQLRVPTIVVAVFALLLVCMELETYVFQAIPFFLG